MEQKALLVKAAKSLLLIFEISVCVANLFISLMLVSLGITISVGQSLQYFNFFALYSPAFVGHVHGNWATGNGMQG